MISYCSLILNNRIAIPSTLKPEILNQAVAVAMASTSRKQLGCIILKKKKIIAAACNYDKKTHTVQERYAKFASKIYENDSLSHKIFLHAEILCLIRSKGEGDTIITARVGGQGGNKLRNSRPCPICTLFLQHHGIKKIHYSTSNGFLFEDWR